MNYNFNAYELELERWERIQDLFNNAPFNLERFTSKEFSKLFRGKYLVSLDNLKQNGIVKLIDTEDVEVKLQKPYKEYYINGKKSKEHLYNVDIENLKSCGVNVEIKNIDKILTKRYYYKLDRKQLINCIKYDILYYKETSQNLIRNYQMQIEALKYHIEELDKVIVNIK